MDFLDPYINYIIIAGVVVVALILLMLIMRAIGGRTRGRRGKRLGISEFRELDKNRRLILVRRDDVEHLILVGGGQSLVIEQGIGETIDEYASPAVEHHREAPFLAQPQEPEYQAEPEYEPEPQRQPEHLPVEPSHRPAPRAPVFGNDRAPNIRPIHRGEPRLNAPDDGY